MKPSFSISVIFSTCVLFTSCIIPSNGERILFIFPTSSKSMANVFEPLVRGLAERGHELTVITPVKFDIRSSPGGKANENVTQLIPFGVDAINKDYPDPFEIRRQNKPFSFPLPFITKHCHLVYQREDFMKLQDEKFDLVIMNCIVNDCFAGMAHKLGAPIILVGTLPVPSPMLELLGNHLPPSFVPGFFLGDIAGKLSFIQRTKSFVYNVYFKIMLERTRPPQEALYREYFGDESIPSIIDIYKEQVSMFFMNAHFSVTRPRPLLPSVLEIGGIHCRPSKALPKDLDEFVSGAKDGFILFSMGSIVKSSKMPESVRLAFVHTFAKLKQRVVWKWEEDGGMPDLPGNVKLVKWLPQQDLLGHPNIKLFITHGGLLSTEEAIYHGVPVLGMPIFVDQDANMRDAEVLGYGIKGEILDLTEAKLRPQLLRILEDPRYMEQVKKLSKIFRDQPESALERSIYWVEYVLRHKGAYHLRSAGMDLNVIQYHSIDVILFLTGSFVAIVLFLYAILKLVLRMVGFGSGTIIPGKNNSSKEKRKRQ